MLQIPGSGNLTSKRRIPDEVVQIGNYRIIKTIGKGSFATVKLAQHVTTNVEVMLMHVVMYAV